MKTGASDTFYRGVAIYTLLNKSIRKALYGIMTVGLALSTMGAGSPTAARHSLSERLEPGLTEAPFGRSDQLPTVPAGCLKQIVQITLASEQVGFCAPTDLPFSAVEDSTSDASVNYAGLSQMDGYGIVNIKATAIGNTPGTGRPVYAGDGAAAYRQAVWDLETPKTDRSVSDGPSGVFWNETVQGIQEDLSLSFSIGNVQVRSIEWYVVHNNRLWSFIITWDTMMQNASEWEAASRNVSVQKAADENPADTAINLGTAFLAPDLTPEAVPSSGPVDVGAPAWWSPNERDSCNDNNFFSTGVHSAPLGANWHGVYACGPKNSYHLVHFFTGAWGEYEFQCVELIMRFLFLEWGIAPFEGNGNTIKDHLPGSMVFYANNGTHGMVPGDIITEDGSTPGSSGHAMIITGVAVDVTGSGLITIMEQNASSSGGRTLSVTNWVVSPDAWTWGSPIQGWLHVKGNQDDGNADATFTPGTGANGRVNAIAIKPNGKILIAGEFTSFNGASRNKVARLNSDGSLDVYNPSPGLAMADASTPIVYALAGYTNGTENWKSLIGGHFNRYNDAPIASIARLKNDGSLDTTFTPASQINADVNNIVIVNPSDANSKIMVSAAGLLFRLNSNGSLASTATTDGIIYDIAIQSDGYILIGGTFSKVNGINRAGIARLDIYGNLDEGFNPSGTGASAVNTISLDPDGRVLIGGTFTTYNDTPRNKVARLNSNGTLDTTFNPGTGFSGISDYVQTILAQTDGRILVGGKFSTYNGDTLNNFGRLNYDGSRDTTFFANMDGPVQALALQPPDGKIVVIGDFTNRVARMFNHVESCYTLTTLVTPVSGGSVSVDTAPNCLGSKYLSGTQVQLTVNLNMGFWLVNWSGDVSGTANPLSFTMDADKTANANLTASPGASGLKIFLPLVGS